MAALMAALDSLFHRVYNAIYVLIQLIIIAIFKPPTPHPNSSKKPYGRIAIIGAGLTGVSSAAHAMSHNFDVVIFEQASSVGGIWANVNSTSGLQLNSLLYRFHPGVKWSTAFPHRDEIISEIKRIWNEYGLESRTRFNTKVAKVTRHPELSTDPKKGGHSRWVINDGEDGIFDAIIVTVGTCGDPAPISFPNQDQFTGRVVHSSELDSLKPEEVRGKRVVVVGSGASGVEAAELSVEKKAKDITIVARDDKWIIPRNIVFSTLLAMQPFGREMPLSFIPETMLKQFHYRDLRSLAPKTPFYAGTPVVNDAFLQHIREGRISYVRGDTMEYAPNGIKVNVRGKLTRPKVDNSAPATKRLEGEDLQGWKVIGRSQGKRKQIVQDVSSVEMEQTMRVEEKVEQKKQEVEHMVSVQREDKTSGRDTKPEDEGREEVLDADIIVMATGFKPPSIAFLPKDLFPDRYERPNLYLQTFSTEDWSILLTNAAYKNAIGTVGHFHIGIYLRILLTFLLDPSTRPSPDDLKLWVDLIRYIKKGAPGGSLSFFTYMELMLWCFAFFLFRFGRIKWALFVLLGWGTH